MPHDDDLPDFTNHAPVAGGRVIVITPDVIERSEGVWDMTGAYDDDPHAIPTAYTCNGTSQIGYELWCAGTSIEGVTIGCQLAADLVATIGGMIATGDAALGDTVVMPIVGDAFHRDVVNVTMWVGQPEADLQRYAMDDAIAAGATLVAPILWSVPLEGAGRLKRLNGERS